MHAEDYVTALNQTAFQEDATEHTFRPALKTLIERFDPAIIATNEPARKFSEYFTQERGAGVPRC